MVLLLLLGVAGEQNFWFVSVQIWSIGGVRYFVNGLGCRASMAAAGLARAGHLLISRHEYKCGYCKPCSNPKYGYLIRDSPALGYKRHLKEEPRSKTRLVVRADAADNQKLREQQHEIRVCINKTCRKSGSLEMLDVIRSLAPPNVTVESCSCIGSHLNQWIMTHGIVWYCNDFCTDFLTVDVLLDCRDMWQRS